MKNQYVWLFFYLLLISGCIPESQSEPTAVAPPEPGTLIVNPTVSLGSISPLLLGSNYGPWIAVSLEMLPAAYASGVKVIRFPGGNWGDLNDLKPYQIDSFMAFVEQVGAVPTLSVRLLGGTVEQATELVNYVNIEQAYGVEYWSIGNEPTLYAGALRRTGKADDYDAEQFNRDWRVFALAMKEVDPTIKLLGPEVNQFSYHYQDNPFNGTPKDSSGRDWMVEFLKANGDIVDVITFHRYPFPSDERPKPTIEDLRQHTQEWETTIIYLRSLIQQLTGREIPIAVTEVNSHYSAAVGGEATPDSHYNGIWLAESLGRLMRQDVLMVNHWLLTSHGGYGGWGLIGRGELRPSYYVYQLYSQFGSEMVYANSGVADVSIYAARREDGTLTVMLVNLADTEKVATLQLTDGLPAQAELWRLDQQQNPEAAEIMPMPADGTLSLPAQSVSLLVFY